VAHPRPAAPAGAGVSADAPGQRRGRLGIIGGTFDPVHYGHLVAADQARWHFELDRVVFVPTGQPWQKPVGVTAPEHRFQMVRLATADNPGFSVSRVEIDAPGPTYTVDTLRRLRAGMDPGTRLFFIAGADAVLDLPSWKDPDELLGLTEIIAVTRPGWDLSRLAERLPAAAGRVHTLALPALDISSTDLRARVAAGAPVRYLVPDPVADYVAEHGLYRATADR
jgi:nicotinate-nucleotide adenylyltransferase